MIGVRLGTSDRTIGTLNLYDSRPHHFSVADVEVAHVLARHAAIALDRAADSENFARALDSRKLIGQAQGILMERFDLDDARAFRGASPLLTRQQHQAPRRRSDRGGYPQASRSAVRTALTSLLGNRSCWHGYPISMVLTAPRSGEDPGLRLQQCGRRPPTGMR
jgi:GAF domain-containing protein